ncbi:MAG TPA: hypothetical protein VF185_03800 [Patescibacteria group bacterium]
MSAEQPQFMTDGEIESLLTPHLDEENQVIQVGRERLAELKDKQRELLSKKIIPGLEARKKDLGNFCTIFIRSNKDKLLVFTQPFGEENKYYLGIHPDGIFQFRGEQRVKGLFEIFFDRCNGRSDKSVEIKRGDLSRIFGSSYYKSGNPTDGWGFVKFVYFGGQNLSELVSSESGWHKAGWSLGAGYVSVASLDFNVGLDLISDRIHELEERKIVEAQSYDTDSSPVVEMRKRVERLEDLSAMLPEPQSAISRVRGCFKFKRK